MADDEPDERRDRQFEDSVQRKIERKIKMQANHKGSIWFWL